MGWNSRPRLLSRMVGRRPVCISGFEVTAPARGLSRLLLLRFYLLLRLERKIEQFLRHPAGGSLLNFPALLLISLVRVMMKSPKFDKASSTPSEQAQIIPAAL